MLEKLHKIPFCLLRLRIKFLTQNSVDLLTSHLAIEEFPNSGRDGVLQSIEPSDLCSGLLDRHKQDHPIDQSPGKQWILFKAPVDEVFQLLILVFPAAEANRSARLKAVWQKSSTGCSRSPFSAQAMLGILSQRV